MRPDRSVRRVVAQLVASFALTIAAFISAAVVSGLQGQRIRAEASLLSENALIAADALSEMRTHLRTTARLTQHLSDGRAPAADSAALARDLAAARDLVRESLARYRAIPSLRGEEAMAAELASAVDELSASIDRALQRLGAGDPRGASEEIIARAEPAITHLDDEARQVGAFNRRVAREGAARIGKLAPAWDWGPNGVSAVLALVTAYLAIRVVRQSGTLMEQRSRELEQFAGRVAHDIKSPLTVVSLALDVANRSPSIDAEAREAVLRGIRTVLRMEQLVDGLLAFAAAGKPPPEAEGAGVRAVLDGVVEGARTGADAKAISLDYEPPSPGALVACSAGVLISITTNLLDNAIKYMGDAPRRRVSLRARAVGRFLRIEVSDTGPGVPVAVRATVFDPHVRGPESAVPGLGLGLATVRRLAEAHGGKVGVRPNADAGSLFWVELPVASRRREPASTL